MDLVGRDRELDDVERRLGSRRIVTITGPGGIGKTRLAREAAGRVDGRVGWVDLTRIDDAHDIAPVVADQLGYRDLDAVLESLTWPEAVPAERRIRLQIAADAPRDSTWTLRSGEAVLATTSAVDAELVWQSPSAAGDYELTVELRGADGRAAERDLRVSVLEQSGS